MNNFLYLVWYEKEKKILNLIAKITYENNCYRFEYLNFNTNELQLFSKNGLYYGFMDINEIYESDKLFPTILNRLPSKKRVDYDKIMKMFNFSEDATDFEILEKTKGINSNDKFRFITEDEYNELRKEIN